MEKFLRLYKERFNMLSILITIYNYNLLSVVLELHKQCLECEIDFEILTQDDASNSVFNIENQKINLITNCSFVTLKKNLGLRENKNLLVAKSKFDNLLILDGDCIIINSNFIRNYLAEITKDYEVVYGGRKHPQLCPALDKKLRWKYGLFIEDKVAIKRALKPYQSLIFNNTMIKKKCFNSVKFDLLLKTYGHDDTLFSFELMKQKIKITHIENSIQHNDIDTNQVFLLKTSNALKNLNYLYLNKIIDRSYFKLINLYHYLRISKISILVSRLYLLFENKIESNLKGNNPSLLVFNIFRIGYLCSLKK